MRAHPGLTAERDWCVFGIGRAGWPPGALILADHTAPRQRERPRTTAAGVA